MTTFILTGTAFILAVLHIWSDDRGYLNLALFLKTLTIMLIVGIALTASPPAGERYQVLIVAGLVASLAGDTFMALKNKRFIAGLASFLVAHLLYSAAFAGEITTLPTPALALLFIAFALSVYKYLSPALGKERNPVIFYIAAIAIMGWLAAARYLDLQSTGAQLAMIGAFFFMMSDTLLAINRFRNRFAGAQIAILSTYYTAQFLIAHSVRFT